MSSLTFDRSRRLEQVALPPREDVQEVSDEISGPWKLVTFMERFGEQGYFVNMPSKFISNDGLSAWLCYSANYTNTGDLRTEWKSDPVGSGYHLTLQEIRLVV